MTSPKITLRFPRLEDEMHFLNANSANWGEFPFAHYWESLAKEDFKIYVKILPLLAQGINLPEGHVPCSFLFAYNQENEIVGRISIRHELTDSLLKDGGHIGYAVIPKFRQQGFATAILKEGLSYIQQNLPKIKKILLTCDETNLASQKTIEKNQGKLENILKLENKPNKMRYWISLN